jgi:Cys-tRNA(Pro) deacylase
MSKSSHKVPNTPAVRTLRSAGVDFVVHSYRYVDRGGTRHAAESLDLPEHMIIKTLVMEALDKDGKKWPLLILMHGDREVSTKQLARELGVKSVEPASQSVVSRVTGYIPGGVSPFGTRTSLPVYVESTIFQLDRVLLNGGKRGLQVEIDPAVLRNLLSPREVNVGIEV